MKKSKRCKRLPVYAAVALAVALLLGAGWMRTINEPDYQLELIELDGDRGYGYKINRGEQMVVYQPFVPVLSQRITFSNAEDAERVGSLVLKRLKSGRDFSVTEDDLKRLGVGKW